MGKQRAKKALKQLTVDLIGARREIVQETTFAAATTRVKGSQLPRRIEHLAAIFYCMVPRCSRQKGKFHPALAKEDFVLTSSELRYYIKGQLRGKMRLRDVLSVRAPDLPFWTASFEVTSEFSQRWMLSTLDATQARDWVRLIRIAVTAKKQHAELKDAEHLDLALRFSEGHACLNKRSRLMQMLNELLSDREIVTETLRGLRSMIKLIHAAMNEPHAMTLSQELPSCKTPTIIAATGAWPFLGLGSWKASDGNQERKCSPAKQNPANTEASFTIAASFLGLAGSITDSGDGFEIRGNGVGYATLASIYGDKIDVRTPLGANERASDVPDIPVDASLRFCARWSKA